MKTIATMIATVLIAAGAVPAHADTDSAAQAAAARRAQMDAAANQRRVSMDAEAAARASGVEDEKKCRSAAPAANCQRGTPARADPAAGRRAQMDAAGNQRRTAMDAEAAARASGS